MIRSCGLLAAMGAFAIISCSRPPATVPTDAAKSAKVSGVETESKPSGRKRKTRLVAEDQLHPAFGTHKYPGSKAVDSLVLGKAHVVWYHATDSFANVVDHYKKSCKGGATVNAGYFFSEAAGAKAFSITVTPDDDVIQIILRMDKE